MEICDESIEGAEAVAGIDEDVGIAGLWVEMAVGVGAGLQYAGGGGADGDDAAVLCFGGGEAGGGIGIE